MRTASKVTVVCCLLFAALTIAIERRLKDPHVRALHPSLAAVSLGPANAKDDAGRQMFLIALIISNVPNRFASVLYVKGTGEQVEANLGSDWVHVDCDLTVGGLLPSQTHEIRFTVPEGAVACRVRFQYTGSCLDKGRKAVLVYSLPNWIVSKLPRSFTTWVGVAYYGPGSEWLHLDTVVPIVLNDGNVAPN